MSEMTFDLEAEMTDTELLALGEAVKGASKLKKNLDRAIAAIKKENAKAAIAALKDAIESIESYGYAYGYAAPKESEDEVIDEAKKKYGYPKGIDAEAITKLIQRAIKALDKDKPDFDRAMTIVSGTVEKLGYPKPKEAEPIPDNLEYHEAKFAESMSGIVGIANEGDIALAERQGPLMLDIEIIKPGWGNSQDNNYYSAQMLKRNADKFVGAKMYETDHREEDKSTRTWVSTIVGVPKFTEDGGPVGKVLVHDPGFAERILNLNEGKLLDKMECSILASGKAYVGEAQGKKGNIVEAITEVASVDWVTKAGAGGHALNLAEADPDANKNAEDNEPTIKEILSHTVSIKLLSRQFGELTFAMFDMVCNALQQRDDDKALRVIQEFASMAGEILGKIGDEGNFSRAASFTPLVERVELQEGQLSKMRVQRMDEAIGNVIGELLGARKFLQEANVTDDTIIKKVAEEVSRKASTSKTEEREEIEARLKEVEVQSREQLEKVAQVLMTQQEPTAPKGQEETRLQEGPDEIPPEAARTIFMTSLEKRLGQKKR